MVAQTAIWQLRLRALRLTAATLAVSLAVRQLIASPMQDALLVYGRWLILLYCVYVVLHAKERTAWLHGTAVTVAVKLLTTLKALHTPHGHVVVFTVAYGANRLVPLLAAIFGGVRFSVAMTAWTCLDFLVIVSYKRVQDGGLTWAQLLQDGHWRASHDPEMAMLWSELNYICVTAALACGIVYYFRSALLQLDAALKARQRFINNMNHEIRTPLVGVLGMTDLLLMQTSLAPAVAEQLQVIHESGNALLHIINNILDVSKLSAGMVRLESRACDIRRVVTSTMDTFLALAVSRGLAYERSVDPALPPIVRTDGTRIQQILGNLLGNAFKFTSSGGVWVTVGFSPGPIDDMMALLFVQPFERAAGHTAYPHSDDALAQMAVFYASGNEPGPRDHTVVDGPQRPVVLPRPQPALRWRNVIRRTVKQLWSRLSGTEPPTRPPPCRVWIRVVDTGTGVSKESLPQIIEPFQQADDSTTRRFGGTGLGLTICTELVQLLGGDFVIASAEGIGSIFLFSVPCAVDDPLQPLAVPPAKGADDGTTSLTVDAAQGSDLARSSSSTDAGILSFPLPPPVAAAALPRTPLTPVPPARPLVVMIADDNQLNVQVLSRQLHLLECQVVIAHHGQECVDMVQRYLASTEDPGGSGSATSASWATVTLPDGSVCAAPPHLDLILMDLHMPVLDGFGATRAIRDLEARLRPHAPHVPIVPLSADDPEAQRLLCRQAGMEGFLRKPVLLQSLRHLLDTYARKRSAPP